LTGLGALVGARAFWVVVGEVVGVAIAWFFMARPFKSATDRFDSITVPDYLASRFGGPGNERAARTLRLVSAAALALFVTIYVSARIDATGKAFGSFLGWQYHVGAIVGFGIVVAYTLSGGFVAVAWSDLFQGIVMFVGLAALPLAASLVLAPPGGGEGALAALGGDFAAVPARFGDRSRRDHDADATSSISSPAPSGGRVNQLTPMVAANPAAKPGIIS
jgi:Na+/proline symporter